MAREYQKRSNMVDLARRRFNIYVLSGSVFAGYLLSLLFPTSSFLSPGWLLVLGFMFTVFPLVYVTFTMSKTDWVERERLKEVKKRGGKPVLGLPPKRRAFQEALQEARKAGKVMIDKYLVGFELDSGEPMWVADDDLCTHAAVFAKTGVGKTLWLESLMFQQLARGRASGLTFIDAKRDMGTLADIIMMCLMTGRLEDLVVIDPFDPVCSYNFVFTTQRPDVKARKVLRCGLPPTSDQSTTKHYDRLAADAVYRVVRAMESLGLAWSVRDIAVALSAFNVAYPRVRELLQENGQKQAMVELGHLAGSYRSAQGKMDPVRITDNLRGIASELHSIANSESGEMFCAPRADLSLTDAILRGKIIYYMLPRLEEAESAARMVKVFREDLEVSIGEVTSNRDYTLEDPHLVIIDEGASTFGPTWANLFELARKGRFALLFGAQSVGGLMDETMGLSEQFYERVIANVNLKVIMRVGDNRTAMDMSEWIGKVTTEKKSYAVGQSTGINAHEFTKNIEVNRRSAEGQKDGVTIATDEEDLVSPEELKHEMSAEKGLAWFDLGDGRLRKGRALWFNADLPQSWEGRELLVRYESVEADEIGLAEWVDETILSVEEYEARRKMSSLAANQAGSSSAPSSSATSNGASDKSSTSSTSPSGKTEGTAAEGGDAEAGGTFRFNMMGGFRGRGRGRTVAYEAPATPPAPSAKAEPKDSAEEKNCQEKGPQEKKPRSEPKSESVEPQRLASPPNPPKSPAEAPTKELVEDMQQKKISEHNGSNEVNKSEVKVKPEVGKNVSKKTDSVKNGLGPEKSKVAESGSSPDRGKGPKKRRRRKKPPNSDNGGNGLRFSAQGGRDSIVPSVKNDR